MRGRVWIMRRRQDAIQAKTYLPLASDGAAKLCLDDLNGDRRDYLGALLHITFLNALYAGRIRFWVEDIPSTEDIFPVSSQ